MKYRELGHSGIRASVVALGTFGLGGGRTWSDTHAGTHDAIRLLEVAQEQGINLIDTAPVYGIGHSETMLGEALKGRRDKFFIQTKCGLNWRDRAGELEYVRDGVSVYKNLTAAAIVRDAEDSLKRMQLDVIDVYITHRQTDRVPVEETMGALRRLIEQGKIRAVGISNASPEILQAYAQIGPVALVQEKYSILSPQAESAYFPMCKACGTSFQVYASLESGALTGPQALGRTFPEGDVRQKNRWFHPALQPHLLRVYESWQTLCEAYGCSLANLVQAWTVQQSDCINLLTGFRRVESLLDTCRAMDITLSEADMAQMRADCDRLRAIEIEP